MPENDIKILVTDDERAIRNALREILEFEGYNVLEAENGKEAFDIISTEKIDLILLDIKMRGMDGMDTLTKLGKTGYKIPVIMLSGHGTIETAVEATKKGAYDFLEKPPDLNRLLISIRNALANVHLQREVQQIRQKLPILPPMIGESSEIQHIRQIINKVAPTQSRVLISGENGTGKELVARWIHEKSNRSDQQFIAVNCAAIPAELIESELFGYVKGAFTGAEKERVGKFRSADKGTLFLDEIGDLSLEAQAAVLRALQEQEITPVGSDQSYNVDVRVIAATNKELSEEIREGKFREDLYHRIRVIPIHIPPLRERKKDIPQLARHILQELQSKDVIFERVNFSDDGLSELTERNWSGNIRELQNAVERLAILTPDHNIDRKVIQDILDSEPVALKKTDQLLNENLSFHEFRDRAEAQYFRYLLDHNGWNVAATAEAAGIQRSHLYNKLKKYNIER